MRRWLFVTHPYIQLTRIDPRDGICQELSSQIEKDHQESDTTSTKSDIALGNTSSLLKFIGIFELRQLGVESGKHFLDLGLDALSTIRTSSGHFSIVFYMEKRKGISFFFITSLFKYSVLQERRQMSRH